QQGSAVSFGQVAALDQLERFVGQVEQADEVGDRDAGAADPDADLFAGQPELLDQGRAGARLLDRVEVLAGHVLDQREFERGGVVVPADDGGNRLELGQTSGTPPALARDQL